MSEYHPEWEIEEPTADEFHYTWKYKRPRFFKRCRYSNKLIMPGTVALYGTRRGYGTNDIYSCWASITGLMIAKLKGKI